MRVVTSAWDGLDESAGEADHLAALRRERDRLGRQVGELKRKHSEYLETVREAVEGAVSRIHMPPVPFPAHQPGPGSYTEGDLYAVALLSDLQTGKKTPDYDSAVAAERVARYADRIIEHSQAHPVRHCIVPLLGDVIEGVDIFPGQQWLIDSTLYAQVFNTTPVILAGFCQTLLAHFETVTVYAVDGNHGRIGRKGQYGPEDNADKMVYRVLGLLMRNEPRFELKMRDPEGERNWYQVLELGAYKALLIHGDQIRGQNGFPWYNLARKVQGWRSGGLGPDSDFQDVFMGHWHQLARIPVNQSDVWVNGSTESTNTFAAEVLAAQSKPSQWLLFVDPRKGRVTASYGVDLTEE